MKKKINFQITIVISILLLVLFYWLFFFSDFLKDFLLSLEVFIKEEKEYVYLFAFLAAIAEGTIILGIIPGTSYIVTLGVFWARGDIDPFLLFPIVITGAFIGDFLGYSIGKIFSKKVEKKYNNSENYNMVKNYIKKYGGRSIFFARFINGIKELVPFVAGILSMKMKVFILWNFLGSIGWSILWITVGYILGDIITDIDNIVKSVGVGVLTIFGISLFLFYRKNKKKIKSSLMEK